MNSVEKPKKQQVQNIKSTPSFQVKTNTLAIVSLVMAFIVPLIGLILSIVALNQLKKSSESGKGFAIAALVASIVMMISQFVIVLAVIYAASTTPVHSIKEENNQATTTTQSQQQTTQTPAEKELTYEIVSENKKGTTNRVTVYTTESTDDRLIKLNDKLLEQYKLGMTHLYIDYFNDKAVASTYFEKQLDPDISDAEQDQLYTHYIANMVYNTTTGLKTLRRSVPDKILKTY